MQSARSPRRRSTSLRRLAGAAGLALALAPFVVGSARAAAGTPTSTRGEAIPAVLSFRAPGMSPTSLELAALRRVCGEQAIAVDDPYHERRMHYRALPFRCVLDQGFAARGGAASLAAQSVLLRARDGYTRPAAGEGLADAHAFLAFGEVGLDEDGSASARFSPIDRRKVDPAPFYLVWTDVARGDPHAHPWPYQLVTIEVARFEEAFPHTVPRDLAKSDPGWRGYALFQANCSACHAINGEGGKVGPDLNVPQSIVEYRPIPQIRAYVRDPQATRYTSMPAHPGLGDADLDALIAYFEAMSRRKHDPRAAGAGS